LEASLLMESVAVNLAAAFGLKEMLRFVLCPADKEMGKLGAVNAKYFVDTDALPMLTALFPEFVTVSVRLLLLVGETFPKSRLALPRTKVPICWLLPPPDWLNP
jgi:hypothetical protein